MIGLTSRQAELLAYLRECEFRPTLTDMAKALGHRSKTTAFHIMRGLAERGYIRLLPHGAFELTPRVVVIRGAAYRYIPKTRAA